MLACVQTMVASQFSLLMIRISRDRHDRYRDLCSTGQFISMKKSRKQQG